MFKHDDAIHVLFEHRFNMTILEMRHSLHDDIWESVAAQSDHSADAFVGKNIVHGYDVVTLRHLTVYIGHHFKIFGKC